MNKKREMAKKGLVVSGAIMMLTIAIVFLFPEIEYRVNGYFMQVTSMNGIKIMQNISNLVSPEVVLFVSIFIFLWFIFKEERKGLYFYSSSVLIGSLIAPAVKLIFQRARPSEIFASGYSFPSGHVIAAVAFYGALAFMAWPKYKKMTITLGLMPVIIGISRMYLNVHWLSDVIGGLAFGMAFVCGMALLIYRDESK